MEYFAPHQSQQSVGQVLLGAQQDVIFARAALDVKSLADACCGHHQNQEGHLCRCVHGAETEEEVTQQKKVKSVGQAASPRWFQEGLVKTVKVLLVQRPGELRWRRRARLALYTPCSRKKKPQEMRRRTLPNVGR